MKRSSGAIDMIVKEMKNSNTLDLNKSTHPVSLLTQRKVKNTKQESRKKQHKLSVES